jgi:hypothetical protein
LFNRDCTGFYIIDYQTHQDGLKEVEILVKYNASLSVFGRYALFKDLIRTIHVTSLLDWVGEERDLGVWYLLYQSLILELYYARIIHEETGDSGRLEKIKAAVQENMQPLVIEYIEKF